MFKKIAVIIVVLILILTGNLYISANSALYVEFEVPEYTIIETGGYDYIDIPGGDVLLGEEGSPRIPYYSYSVEYEYNYAIQDVILNERTSAETNVGFNLPMVIQQWTITKSVEPKTGWYPDIDFEWEIVHNADGSNSLDIVVYPVKYNPQTKELLFYRHYSFMVDYILTEVEILSFKTDKPTYQCGEKVEINAEISNAGNAQDLYMDVIIRLYGSDNYVDSLEIRQLKNVTGNCSVNTQWDSRAIEPGNYYAEMILTDIEGNIIASKNEGFALSQFSSTSTTQTDSTSAEDKNSILDWLKDSIIWIIGVFIAVILLVIIIIVLKHKSKH
ncbi:MAG: hypothetical protein PHF74_04700 [Dehalococcoidales bacterium]|nr:hypothetical protein [Dehalococcoidales bacterium]